MNEINIRICSANRKKIIKSKIKVGQLNVRSVSVFDDEEFLS